MNVMFHNLEEFPGNRQHQVLLKAVTDLYAYDQRVLALSLFGSLGRGNWDEYSDLDMDVIVTDDVQLDVRIELQRLADAFRDVGEAVALIIPDGEEEGDLVLQSLAQVSIRYHTLSTTSPNILDTLLLLAGSIEHSTIDAAGRGNMQIALEPLERLLGRCLRYALGVEIAVQRGQVWLGVEQLHRMRHLIMQIFCQTHLGERPMQTFQSRASRELQKRLGSTLPGYEIASVQAALLNFLEILQNDLPEISNGEMQLSTGHLQMLEKIRARLETG